MFLANGGDDVYACCALHAHCAACLPLDLTASKPFLHSAASRGLGSCRMSREEDWQKPHSLVVVFVRSGKLTYNEDFWQDEVADYPVREHGRADDVSALFHTDGHGRLQMIFWPGGVFTRVFLCCRGAGRSWRRASARSRSTYSPACTQRSSRHIPDDAWLSIADRRICFYSSSRVSRSTQAFCRQSLVLTDFCCLLLSRRLSTPCWVPLTDC